ncbi:MAG: sigma-70 family RNA polymerase sigma factor [Nannocystaceae bacterium]|nr:sigma-70 family RNA polymerase sigma factor [Nannocystaceae bacterium]
MQSDLELLDRWRAGDEDAGNALFDRHFEALYRFFRNKVGDGIDDLVQQTMLGCVSGRERFREDASFRTYLFAIARNVLFKHFDRRSRDADRFDPEQQSVADLGESPSHIAAARAEQRLLALALRQLPLDDQIALELYYWEEMTAVELAQTLGLTEPAVRSRLRRALERLRERVAAAADSPAALESVSLDLDRWAAALRPTGDHD